MPVRLLQVTALAAFFCASGAHAGDGFDSFMGKVFGNSTTVSYGTGGTPLATSSANLGTPHTYGGVGVDTAGPAVKGNVTVPLGNTGKSVQVAAKAAITRENFAKGLIKLAKLGRVTPGGLLAGIAIEAMIGYGLKNIRLNGDDLTADSPDSGAIISDGHWYGFWNEPAQFPTLAAACASKDATPHSNGNGCNGKYGYISAVVGNNVSCPAGWYIKDSSCTKDAPLTTLSEQELYDYMVRNSGAGWPTSSAVALQGMLQYPDIRPILRPYPDTGVTLTGPQSVPGATTKTSDSVKLVPGTNVEAPPGATPTDSGTKTTTSTKTHPVTYNGSEVKYGTITNNVTSITNNVTNVTTTETTKTEEKQDDNEPDLCEKHPNTIGCKEIDFDTPEGEIPRKQIDVSWSPVDLGLGGGSCPAPVQIYENKQFSYQLACDNLYLIKPMVIAIALFVGGMIIFGGRADQ